MLLPFDKYDFYHRAVQSSAEDVKFYLKTYKEIHKGKRREEHPFVRDYGDEQLAGRTAGFHGEP